MAVAAPPALARVFTYIDEHLDAWCAELAEWIRIPSVGQNDAAMAEARAWITHRLERAGLAPEALPAEPSHPVVLASKQGATARRLLFFNHYDVANYTHAVRDQATEFTGEVRDGKIFGRGVADDKGCLFSRAVAVEALLRTMGELPTGVTFVMQGKRQADDPGLAPFVARNRDRLQTDAVIWESGAKDDDGRPVMSLGAKGYLYLDVSVRRTTSDYPSRLTIFPNAAWDLTWALASLKDRQERVLVDGFYDDVDPISPSDEELLRTLAVQNEAEMLAHYGAGEFLLGQHDAALARRLYLTPSCTICGLSAGYSGPGQKLIVPAESSAKLELRLVPSQDPQDIFNKLRRHFDRTGYPHVQVELLAQTAPVRTPPDHPIVTTALRAASKVYDRPMIVRPVSIGMSPKYVFKPLPTIGLGVEYAGSRMEMPDEHIRIQDFREGVKMIAALLMEHADGSRE